MLYTVYPGQSQGGEVKSLHVSLLAVITIDFYEQQKVFSFRRLIT